MSDALPNFSDVQAHSLQLQLGTGASELHGGLCGWLAGGGDDVAGWLGPVLADDGLPVPAPDSALDTLRRATAAQLEDRSFGFTLLLPDDAEPLHVRSGALFDWCRGFLGGFGLAAGARPQLSDEGEEALNDIAKLAAAMPEAADDEIEAGEEDALTEIEEFVRVAALLVHGDVALGTRHRARLN